MTSVEALSRFNCASCAVEFGITKALYKRRVKDHSTFYCPNGHGNKFNEDTEYDDDDDDEEEEEHTQQRTKPRWKHSVYQLEETNNDKN